MFIARHYSTIGTEHRALQTACSGWLSRRIYSGGCGATLLSAFWKWDGHSVLYMTEDVRYEHQLFCMLRRIRNAGLNKDLAQDAVEPIVDLCCPHYPFRSAWLNDCCAHFHASFDVDHRFRERSLPSPLFIPSHQEGACVISQRIHLYLPIGCPKR